jgi:hypothetical protein
MTEKQNDIINLFRSPKTVFTFKDMALLLAETNTDNLKSRLNYYIKKGILYHVRKGIYAKDANYDHMELATKIFTPSYISMETVLAKEGMIFQHYDSIFAISYLTRKIDCDGQTYIYRKIKDVVLANQSGLEKKENYYIATKERAFLDMIYLNKDYFFDNLSVLDFDKCYSLLSIYRNKALKKNLNSYYKLYHNA